MWYNKDMIDMDGIAIARAAQCINRAPAQYYSSITIIVRIIIEN